MFDKLQSPKIDFSEVASKIKIGTKRKSDCVKHFLDNATLKSLESDEHRYFDARSDYSKIQEKNNINDFTKEESINLYKNQFKHLVRDNFLKQYLYCSCPICGQEVAGFDIDHVLPKSKYAQYTVTPVNLVPMCSSCNRSKSSSKISFNPYFQDFSCLPGVTFVFNFLKSPYVNLKFNKESNQKFINCMNTYSISDLLKISSVRLFRCMVHHLLNEGNVPSINNIKKSINVFMKNPNVKRWQSIFYNCLLNSINEFYSFLIKVNKHGFKYYQI